MIGIYPWQSFPVSYAKDMVAMAIIENVAKVVLSYGEMVSDEEVERTRALWEDAYNEPYDMAGSEIDVGAVSAAREAFYWAPAASEEDANRLYKILQPRFLMEVYRRPFKISIITKCSYYEAF